MAHDAEFLEHLYAVHHKERASFPSRRGAERFLEALLGVLFPHHSDEDEYRSRDELIGGLARIERGLTGLLTPLTEKLHATPEAIAGEFIAALPRVYAMLWRDAQAILAGDPASESLDEVIAAYPGFYAIAAYRIAHCFYHAEVPVFPRLISEYAHRRTGVDIHPGAAIGEAFFIDHATGIVIGETTIIGDHVKLYQGVTLGALSVSKEMCSMKRHPTIEDNVIIYSNATILGGETVIGHDSVIGGNAWLTKSVEPYSLVYNRAEVTVRSQRDEG
ncbi:MAG: serine O-acetyltransferase [Spirochaeta sp.]|jgi:serine O-acetyltransferase|nr:serine O-acetyltransferase [Spirochaeta sp.]